MTACFRETKQVSHMKTLQIKNVWERKLLGQWVTVNLMPRAI